MFSSGSWKMAALALVAMAAAGGGAPARGEDDYRSLGGRLTTHFPQVRERSRSYLSRAFVRDAGIRRPFDATSIATSNVPDAARGLKVQKDTILLQLQPSTDVEAATALLKKYELRVSSGVPEIGLLIVEVEREAAKPSAATVIAEEGVEELKAIIRNLRQEPLVRAAAMNTLLAGAWTPKPSDGSALAFGGLKKVYKWDWRRGQESAEALSLDGNWGQKFVRFPAAWNFNELITRARPGALVGVGVLDVGFAQHVDLDFVSAGFVPLKPADHGNHVTGIIAARFNDGIGVDGGSRFARVTVCTAADSGGGAGVQRMDMILSDILATLVDFIIRTPDLKAINLSLGYNWVPFFNRDPDGDNEIKQIVESQGVIARSIADLAAERKILLVCAAGNDSGPAVPRVDARWSSPFNWAAVNIGVSKEEGPAQNILVVESVGRDGGRSAFSNVNGNLAAPGEDILSAISLARDAYGLESGTSMAAPQVTALVAQLYAYNPDLTPERVVAILKSSAHSDPSHAPTIDAFAAMLECYEADRPLHDLADLDQSGRVDMADFEIFRAALRQVEGTSTDPAKDLNGDGVVGSKEEENVWPRTDLNGSGSLSRDTRDRKLVKGRDSTDLEVMMRVWQDATVAASDLPGKL
jgi:subtilisin family serine protease